MSLLACRDSYNNLYQDLNSTDDSGSLKLRQVVVSGASGVGTSLFLVFYLLRCACHSANLLVRGTRACCSTHATDEQHFA